MIFDVDGVLLDTMHVWTDAGARYLASLNIEAEPGLGNRLFTMTVDMGAVYVKETYGLSQSLEEITQGINGVVADYYHNEAELKPGAARLLALFHEEGIPMTVASSTAERYIRAAFDRLNVTGYFREILSCVELQTSKSEPEIFYEAMKVMGSRPEETWLFEDGLYSIKTARRAGLRTVGVYDEISACDQEKIKALADIYLTSLIDFNLNKMK